MSEKIIDITIDMVEKDWATDCKIDLTDLNQSSIKQFELHNKYYKILNFARRRHRQLVAEKKHLYILKNDYFNNKMAPAEMKALGWEANRRTILKADLDKWIDCDPDYIDITLKIGDYADIIAFVEDIIQSLNRRSFTIKNIIENKKFENGVA